jgi:putative endonuclease
LVAAAAGPAVRAKCDEAHRRAARDALIIEHVKQQRYFVYITARRSHKFYVGVTNDIERRVRQHKDHTFEGFTSRYNIDRLVWYQIFRFIQDAIAREKQIKDWRREKKIAPIESMNRTWQDLSEEWGKPVLPLRPDRRSLGSGDQQQAACARDDTSEKNGHSDA